jgi:transposase-like protein
MPKSAQPNAKKMIHEMYMSSTKETALKAYEKFLQHYSAKYPAGWKKTRNSSSVSMISLQSIGRTYEQQLR